MRAIIPTTVRNISEMSINLDVEQVRRHKQQLQYFFTKFSGQLEGQICEPLLAYKVTREQFDSSGTLWFKASDLDARSLKLIQTIEDSYMSTSFFTATNGKLGSRGYVYYTSAASDDDLIRAILRLINHADTSARLLRDLYPQHKNRWEFGVYALLDDIRYKLLLIDELDGAIARNNVSLLNQSITIFYDYLQGTMPEEPLINEFTRQVQNSLLLTAAKVDNGVKLRTYKEADNPLQNLIFRDTLTERLANTHIDILLGLRFGGSELPHIMKKRFPYAEVQKVKVSNYSSDKTKPLADVLGCKSGMSVLILDDNILTGRTLRTMVGYLKTQGIREIYFGCVTYSGMKRYPQMIMDDHGVVNPEVLLASCTIGESQYTKITNRLSYKNSNGVFDKVKDKLQKRMNDKTMDYVL